MQFPVFIELRRSVLLSLLLVLLHGTAVVCVQAVPVGALLRAFLSMLVAISAWASLRPNAIEGLRLCAHDRMECVFSGGRCEVSSVLPETTVFVGLIVLRIRVGEDRKKRTVSLLPDQMSAEQFRMLRLWLRWHSNDTKQPAEPSV